MASTDATNTWSPNDRLDLISALAIIGYDATRDPKMLDILARIVHVAAWSPEALERNRAQFNDAFNKLEEYRTTQGPEDSMASTDRISAGTLR